MGVNLRWASSPNGKKNVFDLVKNMVEDYGADNTGVASVTGKFFTDLKADLLNKSAIVTSPAGTYNFATYGGSSFINGAKDITLENTGATWGPNGNFFLATDHIAQIGIDEVGGKSARIQTVSPGATSVTLTTASASAGHISRFSVNQFILVCGWPIQAAWQDAYSFPPNWQFFEFRKITSIVSNTISFSEPLENYYSAAWPEMNRGSGFQVDAAGPASIFALSPYWNGTTTVNGGTYLNSNLINCYRENFIMNGGASGDSSGNLPVYPSVTKLFRLINHSASVGSVEHDKLIDLVDIQGGTFHRWHCQSSSTRLAQFNGATIGSFDGTPGDTVIDNCAIGGASAIGATSYGRSKSLIIRNNSTLGGDLGGGLVEKGPRDEGVNQYMLMSGGVITVPICLSDSATRIMAPDSNGNHVLHWEGNSGTIRAFKVLSVAADSWPAVDDQSATTNVSIASGSKSLAVSSSIFSLSDERKCIIIPGASLGGLRTFIKTYNSPTSVELFDPAGITLSGVSTSIRWGTCNIAYTTSEAGGLPHSNFYPNGKLFIRCPPVKSLRLENVTGTAQALDLSQSAAWDKPLYAYSKRTYDGSTSHSGAPFITLRGALVSIKVNVTKAYTGAGTLNMGFTRFDNMTAIAAGATAYSSYGPRFNLKQTGERVITPGNTTGAWAGTNPDTNLNVATAAWFPNGYQASMSRDISGESPSDWPSFTVEFDLNQGF